MCEECVGEVARERRGRLQGRRFKVQRGVKETEVSGNKEVGDPGVKLPGVHSHCAGVVEGQMAQLV